MPSIFHHGAVTGTTGSCHRLQLDADNAILIDCGLFQGAETSGGDESDRQWIDFPIDNVRALVITHVHIDHVGRLPYLLGAGFRGPIYCSKPSATLLPLGRPAARTCSNSSLSEGFHTRMGDRGIRLSGGQRQRPLIARELFKQPQLLILDEATSSLDSEAERVIQQSIDELRGRMTVVIIAHRLPTVRSADNVLVFEHGRLAEQGAYSELRDHEGSRFSAMVAAPAL